MALDPSFLIQPFQYEFFTRAIVVSVLVGGVCGLIGVYIVLRGMSYIGHGISHAVFGGAVVGYIAGLSFYVGAALWGLASAVLINEITRSNKIKADAAIGVVTTAGFAIGIFLISTTRSYTPNFEALLFGNILGITDQDLWIIVFVTIITVAFIFFFQKRLLFTIFDREASEGLWRKNKHGGTYILFNSCNSGHSIDEQHRCYLTRCRYRCPCDFC